jgi:predicted cupin superfamily sugar epimerase
MNKRTAAYWIQHLKLEKHPEGGAYTRVYTSDHLLKQTSLPDGFPGERPVCTHIYYLLRQNEFSAFHRIRSDELWHFYDGDALKIYEINKDGNLIEHSLGLDFEKGQSPFCIINAGNWFAAELIAGSQYALVGCTVSPGFDFAEFELAEKVKLILQYPQCKELIIRLTK